MLNNITLGQYFPGSSVIHGLDPRTKILIMIALIVGIFVSQGFCGFGLIALFVLLCTKLSKIGFKYILRGLKPIGVILAFTFLLNLVLGTGEDVIWHWSFINITEQGIRNALFMAVRLVLLVCISQLLTLTTSPIRLTDGLESLFKPLARIGFPAHEIAMMMSIALRFIPTLMEETDKITKAQKARGADFETGNLIARARAMLPLLVPLFVSSFRRADELAMAMEARCYTGGNGRTKLNPLKYSINDLWAFAAYAVLLALIIAFNMLGLF